MNLERAVEVAIAALNYVTKMESNPAPMVEERAAATLRAFLEAHKAATAFVEERQPQVTEAMARLKALEEEIRFNDARMLAEVKATYPAITEVSYPAYFGWHKAWRNEIAAIRKAMGGE